MEKIYLKSDLDILIKIFKRTAVRNEEKVYYISKNSSNKHLAITIFIVEQMNRGNLLVRKTECFVAKAVPSFILHFDLSIGPFQMKPSFYTHYNTTLKSLDELLSFENSLDCFEIFNATHNDLSDIQKISLYHSGKIDDISRSTKTYIELYKWLKTHLK